jgi:hypothetical protein
VEKQEEEEEGGDVSSMSGMSGATGSTASHQSNSCRGQRHRANTSASASVNGNASTSDVYMYGKHELSTSMLLNSSIQAANDTSATNNTSVSGLGASNNNTTNNTGGSHHDEHNGSDHNANDDSFAVLLASVDAPLLAPTSAAAADSSPSANTQHSHESNGYRADTNDITRTSTATTIASASDTGTAAGTSNKGSSRRAKRQYNRVPTANAGAGAGKYPPTTPTQAKVGTPGSSGRRTASASTTGTNENQSPLLLPHCRPQEPQKSMHAPTPPRSGTHRSRLSAGAGVNRTPTNTPPRGVSVRASQQQAKEHAARSFLARLETMKSTEVQFNNHTGSSRRRYDSAGPSVFDRDIV